MKTLTKRMGTRLLFALFIALGFGQFVSAQSQATFQILHNSPDPLVANVDIVVSTVVGGNEVVSGFSFDQVPYLGATAVDTLNWDAADGFPTNDSIEVYVNYFVADYPTPSFGDSYGDFVTNNGTQDVRDTLIIFPNQDLILIAEGVADAATFPTAQAFRTTAIDVTSAPAAGQVSVAFHHGSPDAPNVDLNRIVSLSPNPIATDVPFGATSAFQDEAPVADTYFFDVFPTGAANRLATFNSSISPALANNRLLIFATGFLDPTAGPGGLTPIQFRALDRDGNVEAQTPGTFYQLGHFSPDMNAQEVQLLLEPQPGAEILLPDTFSFGEVSTVSFIPGVGNLHIVPAGGSIADAALTIDLTALDITNYQYLVAHGILPSSTGYNVNTGTEFNVLAIPELSPASADPNTSEVVLVHASPDAPEFDVKARDGGVVVTNLDYGDYEILTLGSDGFLMDLIAPGSAGDEAFHTFNLRSEILTNLLTNRIMAVAAGFRDSTVNNAGPDFGATSVVLNGLVIPLQEVTTSTVSIIHNSADPAATNVDVYYDTVSVPAVDDFAYKTSTGKIQLLANEDVRVSINASSSTGPADQVLLEETGVRLLAGEEYFVVASGFADPTAFEANPSGNATALDLYVAMAENREPAADTTALYVFHGATDAPAVDLVETALNVTAVDGATYGDFGGPINLASGSYTLELQADADNSTVVDFGTLDLAPFAGSNELLLATGFLTPNAAGDPDIAFEVLAAPAAGGPLAPILTSGRLENQILQLSAYPNPAQTAFNIDFVLSEAADLNVSVVDMQGRTVYNEQTSNVAPGMQKLQIDVENLANGLYVYRVEANGQVMSGKMSVMR